MRTRIFDWAGRRFIALSEEGWDGGTASEQTERIFDRMEQELQGVGLSLEHAVRSRLWGKDKESRDAGSAVRVEALSGKRRCASSSYVAPGHFLSGASVAVDLLALMPRDGDAPKVQEERTPPAVPLRYNISGGLVFVSGNSSDVGGLEEQTGAITQAITEALTHAGTSWEKAVMVSSFMHRSQRLEELDRLLSKAVGVKLPYAEYGLVDGYSSPGKLLEIEVTAAL